MSAFAEAIARRMIRDGIEQEERRMAERRSHPRSGHGRRASDALARAGVPAFVVAPVEAAPVLYRVVSAPDQTVPYSQTFACGGCGGRGEKVERGVGRPCNWCDGYGRLLRGADGSEHCWPVPCEPVSEA